VIYTALKRVSTQGAIAATGDGDAGMMLRLSEAMIKWEAYVSGRRFDLWKEDGKKIFVGVYGGIRQKRQRRTSF
jgi:hypothetical protein